jgi:hypothetical protein
MNSGKEEKKDISSLPIVHNPLEGEIMYTPETMREHTKEEKELVEPILKKYAMNEAIKNHKTVLEVNTALISEFEQYQDKLRRINLELLGKVAREVKWQDLRPMKQSDLKPGQIVFWLGEDEAYVNNPIESRGKVFAGRVGWPLAQGYFSLMDGKADVQLVKDCKVLV